MAKQKPNAARLGYPELMGDNVKGCNDTAPDVIEAVSKDTCPCFIFSTRTDNVVPICNAHAFMGALIEHDVAFETHIYAYGPHGFSTGDTSIQHKDTEICDRAPQWVADSIGWLKDVLGEFDEGGMTTPACPVHTNGDTADFLSID